MYVWFVSQTSSLMNVAHAQYFSARKKKDLRYFTACQSSNYKVVFPTDEDKRNLSYWYTLFGTHMYVCTCIATGSWNKNIYK